MNLLISIIDLYYTFHSCFVKNISEIYNDSEKVRGYLTLSFEALTALLRELILLSAILDQASPGLAEYLLDLLVKLFQCNRAILMQRLAGWNHILSNKHD